MQLPDFTTRLSQMQTNIHRINLRSLSELFEKFINFLCATISQNKLKINIIFSPIDFSNDEEDNETPTLQPYQQNYPPVSINVSDYQVGRNARSRSAFPTNVCGTRLHRSNTVESRSMAPPGEDRSTVMIRTPQQLARSYEATYLANSLRAAKNYEEDDVYVSSRSSSSSIEDVGASTDIYRRQPNRQSTESRIRRSRSLQLSVRSPSRVPMAARTSAMARPARTSKYPPPTPHPVALMHHQGQNVPQSRGKDKPSNQQKLKQDANTRSLDMDGKSYGGSFDFDPKVTSFDETCSNLTNLHFVNSNNERIFADSKYNQQNQTQRGQQSSSYGSRLYDHELVYQPWRRNRSPIMDYGPKTKVTPKRDSSLPPYHSQTPSSMSRSEQDSSER